MMTVAWPLSPGACVIMSPWCHQPQPQMTESSPSLQITLDMTHTTLSPGSHLVLVSKTWAWQNNLAAREWHLNDWSPAGPGSQSPWCWQLVIHVHAARVITQLPRCNDNTQQVSFRAWSRAETKHRGYWWSLAANSLLPLYQPLLQMCSPSLVFTAAVSWHHWHLMRHLLSQFILRSGMAHVLPGQTPAHNWAPRNVTGPQPLSGPGTQQPRGGDTEAIRPDKTDQDIRVDNKNIKRIVM